MRIACAYHPRQHLHGAGGKFHYIEQAFRNLGHDVRHIETLAELKTADQECELILFEQRQPASIDNNEIVRFAPSKQALWFQWYFDVTCYERDTAIHQQDWWGTFGPTMQAMDVVLLKERDRLREYRGNDVSAVWFDQACPSTMEACEYPEKPEFDVVTWGQAAEWYWQRVDDIRYLAEAGFRIAWAASSGIPQIHNVTRLMWCHPDELPKLCSRGAVALHVDAFQDVDGFYSDRIWLAAGAGACNVRRVTKGQKTLPGFGYANQDVLVSLVQELVENHAKRKAVGVGSRQFVMSQHTYEHRCREIVDYAESFNADRHQKSNVPTLQGDGSN